MSITAFAIWFVIVVAGAIGWIMNIVTIFRDGVTPVTGEVALRIIGVFMIPLGAILGYI
jgi:hypothetical protein